MNRTGKLLLVAFLIVGAFVIICAGAKALDDIRDPNEPRRIVMPKAVPVPVIYKCPVHGVTDATLTLEVDEIRKIYCKKCAITLFCDFLDQNLPKLEVVK